MSQDGISVVRSAFEAINDGGVEAMLLFVAEDFEMQTPAALAAEPDTYRGHDGVRRWFSSFYDAVDSIRFELPRLEEHNGRVVMAFRMTTRGRTTGLMASQEATTVCEVENGEITRLTFHPPWDEAVAAVGD